MEDIYNGFDKFDLDHLPPVKASGNHTVLYHLPLPVSAFDLPIPQRGKDLWDKDHVKLPYSPQSKYPFLENDGTQVMKLRWELIKTSLLQPIKDSRALEKAIKSYNTRYESIWHFNSLHSLFEEDYQEEEACGFFEKTLPQIIKLALRLPHICPSAIPLLKQGTNRSISLSQEQVACLLANAFLCTFPLRNTDKQKSEFATYPGINFSRLYQSNGSNVIEKLKCICNYFRRVCKQVPLGVLTFHRRYINPKDLPKWESSNASFSDIKLHVTDKGTIEADGHGLLQVDFANKFIGGGVLGHGCVQEEIRFVINPELLVSKLFTECLKPQEALIMVGAEQFNLSAGYASSFEWTGSFEDSTPLDESRRRKCSIVGIDALQFNNLHDQYSEVLILRELNKAYVGFYHPLETPPVGVASGNWGCGAFGGDARLKSLIQLMVCCLCQRNLVYYTFGDDELKDKIEEMFKFLVGKKITIAQLWIYLKRFCEHGLTKNSNQLYRFIYQQHEDSSKSSSKYDGLFNFPASSSLFKISKKSPIMTDQPGTSSGSSSGFSGTSQGKSIFSKFSGLKPLTNLNEDYEEFERKRKKAALTDDTTISAEIKETKEPTSSLLDSLDNYYEGLAVKSSPPAKKHCSSMVLDDLPPIRLNLIADFLNGKKNEPKHQDSQTSQDILADFHDNSPPSSQLEAMHTSPDEIPATPPDNWSRRKMNKDGSQFTDWITETPKANDTEKFDDSEKLEDSKTSVTKDETIINISFLDNNDEPSTNELDNTPKRTQKAKITDFFKNKFHRE